MGKGVAADVPDSGAEPSIYKHNDMNTNSSIASYSFFSSSLTEAKYVEKPAELIRT